MLVKWIVIESLVDWVYISKSDVVCVFWLGVSNYDSMGDKV